MLELLDLGRLAHDHLGHQVAGVLKLLLTFLALLKLLIEPNYLGLKISDLFLLLLRLAPRHGEDLAHLLFQVLDLLTSKFCQVLARTRVCLRVAPLLRIHSEGCGYLVVVSDPV